MDAVVPDEPTQGFCRCPIFIIDKRKHIGICLLIHFNQFEAQITVGDQIVFGCCKLNIYPAHVVSTDTINMLEHFLG